MILKVIKVDYFFRKSFFIFQDFENRFLNNFYRISDLKKKGVYFYDSMGSDKNDILRCLLQYLEQEHQDKKKSAFDTSGK